MNEHAERPAFKPISGKWLLILVFRLNTGWAEIIFQLCEHHMKHLTRILHFITTFFLFKKKGLSLSNKMIDKAHFQSHNDNLGGGGLKCSQF